MGAEGQEMWQEEEEEEEEEEELVVAGHRRVSLRESTCTACPVCIGLRSWSHCGWRGTTDTRCGTPGSLSASGATQGAFGRT